MGPDLPKLHEARVHPSRCHLQLLRSTFAYQQRPTADLVLRAQKLPVDPACLEDHDKVDVSLKNVPHAQ